MAAPANDTRAGAEVVPVGAYWGVVQNGTTVDATEDAGGPVDGYGAKDVFYTWSSLPAGQVFIYVQVRPGSPDPGAYFEAATFSGSAGSWTDADDWAGNGWGSTTHTCRFQSTHTGGPFSLAVYTYAGDSSGDEIIFDFGWGHELDATAEHWSTDQDDPWVLRTQGSTTYVSYNVAHDIRGRKIAYTAPVGGTSVPGVTWADCAWGNARDGVVDTPPSTTYGCTYIGPGAGQTAGAFGVGAYYRATGQPSIPPSPDTTGRSDEVQVSQQLVAYRFTDAFFGAAVRGDTTPAGFGAYQAANEGPDDALVWGSDYVDAAPTRDIRNIYLDTVTISPAFPTSPHNATGPCGPTYRALSQSFVWGDIGTVLGAPNRVWLSDFDNGSQATHITPAGVGGATIASLGDGAATDVTFADYAALEPLLVHSAGETKDRWLIALAISTESLSNTPPPFGTPPRSGEYITDAARSASHAGTPHFESRLPTWRAYLGFPLVPMPPPSGGGWSVGIGWAPATAIMALSGTSFTDDFERADLGPDWTDGPMFSEFGSWVPAVDFLADGAWQTADETSGGEFVTAMGSIRRVADAGADQFIEAEVGNFFQGHVSTRPERLQIVEGEVFLFAQIASDSMASVGVYVIIDSGGSGGDAGLGSCYMQIITLDAAGNRSYFSDGDATPLTGWQSNPTYTIRLEVTAGGHCRAYFEGGLVAEDDVTPTGGQHVGIAMHWNRTRYDSTIPPSGESLRVESVTGSEASRVGGWSVG